MSNLILNIEIMLGTDIQVAAEEAVEFAKRNAVCVRFDFNGIKLLARSSGSVQRVLDDYHRKCEMRREKK